ncbi:flagellar basal body-associated FliL family protein [Clostridium rectalis]|uniref:flagellar basal body-associated FliL family protein n=1 Tax=Clostridium rectalis TaxID=2040295 RepID=UPI000F62D566|nr:flagellar basal body-associated FliL family protein [Clostridium rectalis]
MSEKNVEAKSGKSLKIVIIILIIIIIGGGAFGGYMLLNKKGSGISNNSEPVKNNPNVNINANGVRPVVSEYTYDMEEFLVNLADEDGKRFVKAKIFLGYENKKLTKEMENKKPIIRDAINNVLRSKKAKDISNSKGLEQVKTDILNKINLMFENGRCDSVYFNEILIQ